MIGFTRGVTLGHRYGVLRRDSFDHRLGFAQARRVTCSELIITVAPRWSVGELARQHGFEGERAEPPADARGRRAALFAAIARAGSFNRRTLILVDGADLLTDIDGAHLTWLPKAVPPAVRVIVTTNGERPVEAAQRRGWTVVTSRPLDEAERRDFIRVFLDRYAKSLDEIHVARLVNTGSTGNALFLRTVLDELRQHGDHFTIGQVIEHYLAAETLDELLALVLERYEGDFERDRPGLVRDSMRALWAARRGLTEPEILDCLGDVPMAANVCRTRCGLRWYSPPKPASSPNPADWSSRPNPTSGR